MPPHTPKRDTTPYTGRSGRQTPSHETVAKQEYNREISRRKDIEAELEAKDRRLAECENKLKDSEASLVAVRKKWKEAATDLDKVKSSQQRGLYHMTDSELRDSVTRLRYNISRFAIQYFSGKLPGDTSVGEIVDSEDYEGWKDLSDVIGGRHITAEYIRSDRRRPHIIQALIWETIYMDVFGEALWAGEKMAKAFRELSKQLQTPGMILHCTKVSLVAFSNVDINSQQQITKEAILISRHAEDFAFGEPRRQQWSLSQSTRPRMQRKEASERYRKRSTQFADILTNTSCRLQDSPKASATKCLTFSKRPPSWTKP